MNKLLYISTACLLMSACGNYNTKQAIDDTYYKRTQSVAWPTEQATDTVAVKATTTNSKSSAGHSGVSGGVPSADAPDAPEKWHDTTAPAEKVAVPVVPEKKVQCVKKDGAYTCRYGQQICGRGCQSDGSNCSYGYCQKSECDDVMGQKWNWVKASAYTGSSDAFDVYACKHPNYNILCWPSGRDGVKCSSDAILCGWDCNKNGTDCNNYHNNCWDKYR